MANKLLYSFTLIMSVFMTACAQPKTQNNMQNKTQNETQLPMPNETKETIVVVTTDYGIMRIKLYNETPLHRDNFIKLINDGFYNDLLFHRVIKEFMIQGGDPESKGAPASKQLGAGDVGYTIPAEFVFPKYYHKKGALSAARQGDQVNPQKRSSGCQFYIVQGKKMTDQELDGMEQNMQNKAKESRFYEIAAAKTEQIQKLQAANDQAGLQQLQTEILAQIDSELAGKEPQKFTAQMRNDYKTIGGTPFLDNEYTVFGEVIEGLEVIDKIAAVKTLPGDRPEVDLKMKITVE